MKILHIGIFNEHFFGGDGILKKGFELNGHEVDTLDNRSINQEFGQEELQKIVIDRSKNYDLLFMGKSELILGETLEKVKQNNIPIAIWYGDIRPTPEKWLIEQLQHTDFFFMTSGGKMLKHYHSLGKQKLSAYMFNPSDPDILKQFQKPTKKKYDVLFTGSFYNFADDERFEVVKALCKRKDSLIIGSAQKLCDRNPFWKLRDRLWKVHGQKYIRGERYTNFIRKANIGIGVSAKNDIQYYTSDRFTHFISLGTFFLPKYFPGIEELFDPKTELDSFKNIDEMNSKLDYYLQNSEEREERAKRAHEKILNEYCTQNIAKMLLEYINTSNSTQFPWCDKYS
jgi:spore maturation protein CgeB